MTRRQTSPQFIYMQRGFTKLFNTIVTSTIWQEDDKTRIVWITMLAIADAFGNVFAAIPGLASVANVSIEAAEKAVGNLLAPDPYSRTTDFEGRRIEKIDGGWHIINYGKYRKMMDEEERKDYKAKWARENRRHKRTHVDKGGQSKTENGQSGHIPSASSSTSVSEEEIKEYCISLGLPASDGEAMFLHWQEKKWPKNWKLTIQKWKSFGYLPSQKQSSNGVKNGQRQMSAFEIEKRQAAIKDEINATFKRNGGKRVDGDGIDELKQRRDELQRQLTA